MVSPVTEEQVHGLRQALGRSLEQSTQRWVGLFGWRPFFEEQLHYLVVALVCRDAEGGPAGVGALTGVGICAEQGKDCVCLTVVSGCEQRRLPPLVKCVYVGPSHDEQLCRL